MADRENRRSWYGWLAHENVDHVAERIRTMLEDRPYAWVANNTSNPSSFPEVRTDQRLDAQSAVDGKPLRVWREGDIAGITAVDTYGVWGVHTTFLTEKEARDHQGTYLHVVGNGEGRYDRIEIRQKNGYGETLHWVIKPQARDAGEAWC